MKEKEGHYMDNFSTEQIEPKTIIEEASNEENALMPETVPGNSEDGCVSNILIEEYLNPWISIWIKPRKTIRYIVSRDPEHYFFPLAIAYGIVTSLNRASSKNMGDHLGMWEIFLICLIAGAIGGIISVYISGVLIHWIGEKLGGKGSQEEIRAALVWGNLPLIFSSIFWIPELAIFGSEMFTSNTPHIDSNLSLSIILCLESLWECSYSHASYRCSSHFSGICDSFFIIRNGRVACSVVRLMRR
jgi:hypothetical protein